MQARRTRTLTGNRTLLALSMLGLFPSGALAQYSISQIGADSDNICVVAGITNSGIAAGYDYSWMKPFRWTAAGGLVALPAFGTGGQGRVAAVNELGACAGSASTTGGVFKPAYWDPNGSISSLAGRYSYSVSGLNDLSNPTIVGMQVGSPYPPACYVGGKWTILPSLTGSGRAFGADNIGRIVGICFAADGGERVVIWNPVAKGKYQLTDLTATKGLVAPPYGWGNGEASFPVVIRNGLVASMGKILNLATGSITDLAVSGQTGIAINAINSAGQAVGYCDAAPFYWDGSTLLNLNNLVASSGWALSPPTGINDNGQIVGTGLYGGVGKAYVLDLTP